VKTRNVLVYRDTLLPPSETFVLSQGEGLPEFKALYVGSRRVDGIEVPSERSYFISDGSRLGRCREILFKVLGVVPSSMHEMLKRLQPVLVHAHFGPDGVMAQTFARSLHLPLIVTFHGYDATTKDHFAKRSFFLHRNYIRKRKYLLKNCSQVIAVSEFIKGKLLELGVPEEKIVVHYIGIDTNKFEPVPQIHREPIVLFVGRLVEKKGCTYLIQAMKDVQASFPDAELVVIGDGPLRRQLEGEADKSLRKFRFLGVKPHHVVKEWMNRAKVFSVPSIAAESGDAEGFGLVFAEAQAMGVPVVSFQSGGIPEAVSHGETGFLVPEKDWEGLAEYINLLFNDDVLRKRMSDAARARVTAKFDLKRQNEILEQIYKRVAAHAEANI
jgi:glycosyltransferase involved in cell wall biosynthesis